MRVSSNANETRARIIEAAYQSFRHYGYSKTTVADIARACSMSAANVYRFFPSKSAINEAICDLVISELEDSLRQIAGADLAASKRFAQLIELIAQFIAETYHKDRRISEMVAAAFEENWTVIQRHVHVTQAIFADVIASGIESKEFKLRNPGCAARCVCCALAGLWHPVVAAQSQNIPNMPTPTEMTAFLLLALEERRRDQDNDRAI